MSKEPNVVKASEIPLPADLRKALAAVPEAKAAWQGLTPIARRDFISWVEGAKQQETRDRRVRRTSEMLIEGKRRPCCYAVVPMDFYSALGKQPKAKATWKILTPTERRDFIAWVDEAKGPSTHKERIQKACALLASGKRHY